MSILFVVLSPVGGVAVLSSIVRICVSVVSDLSHVIRT